MRFASSEAEGPTPTSASSVDSSSPVDERTNLIMCFDSNAKYLNRRKLWDLDGTRYERTYTLEQVDSFIDRDMEYRNLNYFLISVGTNNTDNDDAETVVEKLKKDLSRN